jgi:hypothetical protein
MGSLVSQHAYNESAKSELIEHTNDVDSIELFLKGLPHDLYLPSDVYHSYCTAAAAKPSIPDSAGTFSLPPSGYFQPSFIQNVQRLYNLVTCIISGVFIQNDLPHASFDRPVSSC